MAGPRLAPLDAAACHALLHDDAAADSLEQALARSIDYFEKISPERVLTCFDQQVTAAEFKTMLQGAAAVVASRSDLPAYVCDHLRLYRAETDLLVTGYYQPELAASRTRTQRFRYPLYRTPDDLVDVDLGSFCSACVGRVAQGRVRNGTLVSYYSRAEIDAGALAGRELEIAWLDDPVEAFFLHVQGSALLRYADGVHMEISYSGSNGRPYTSIGRLLVQQGKLSRETVSLQALKDYLHAHPDEQPGLMAANERYIFFRAVPSGPIGSLGVPLTAGRSLAADAKVYPPGALAFLRVSPNGTAAADQAAFQRFALIQDAGAAIAGPQRVDVFWGTGSTAEAIAGGLRSAGTLYVVLPH